MRLTVVLIFTCLVSMYLHAADTELKFFRPFGEVNPEIPLVVRENYAGQCWQQSSHIKREDAWRCMAGGKTFDPCFIKQYGSHNQALCPTSPWDGTSIQLDLPDSADNTQHISLDMSQAYPWAVELQTGERCLALDEGQVFDGLPIRYQCDNQKLIFGHLQRCKTLWTILQRDNVGKVETVTITKAWF